MGRSSKLYNSDLAPTPKAKKIGDGLKSLTYGLMMFKVYLVILWQHLLFLASGLNGWAVFAALILAGIFYNVACKPIR